MAQMRIVALAALAAAGGLAMDASASYINSTGLPSAPPSLVPVRWDGRIRYQDQAQLRFRLAETIDVVELPNETGGVYNLSTNYIGSGDIVLSGIDAPTDFSFAAQLTWTPIPGFANTYASTINLPEIIPVLGTPALLRQSPTIPSTGMTTITPLGGGQWQVDSFFDIWTEISIDGGTTWIAGDHELALGAVPTPGAAGVLGLGGLMAARRRRRP